jgi:hypothetical protein
MGFVVVLSRITADLGQVDRAGKILVFCKCPTGDAAWTRYRRQRRQFDNGRFGWHAIESRGWVDFTV